MRASDKLICETYVLACSARKKALHAGDEPARKTLDLALARIAAAQNEKGCLAFLTREAVAHSTTRKSARVGQKMLSAAAQGLARRLAEQEEEGDTEWPEMPFDESHLLRRYHLIGVPSLAPGNQVKMHGMGVVYVSIPEAIYQESNGHPSVEVKFNESEQDKANIASLRQEHEREMADEWGEGGGSSYDGAYIPSENYYSGGYGGSNNDGWDGSIPSAPPVDKNNLNPSVLNQPGVGELLQRLRSKQGV